MPDTLTKAHIVDSAAVASGYTRNKSFEIVEISLQLTKAALESGDNVMISGFERFCVKERAKRCGGNPATGKILVLGPRKIVTFKWSGKLKEKLNFNLPLYNSGGQRRFAI